MNRAADDLISRAIACDEISKMIHECREKGDNDFADALILVRRYVLKQLPAVDAVPAVRGQWVEKRWMTECDWCVINHRALVCTACNIEIADGEKTPYCPYCGAKMEAKNE